MPSDDPLDPDPSPLTDPGRALPVRSIGITLDTDGGLHPTAVIDAADRPDVADLARVHAVEGIGDIRTTAALDIDAQGVRLTLAVTLRHPVRAAFAVAFRLPEHRPALADAAAVGHLVLATVPADDEPGPDQLWLAVDVDGEALARLLAAGDELGGRPGDPGRPDGRGTGL